LDHELVWFLVLFTRSFYIEHQPVVEGRLSVLATVVSIGLLFVMIVDVALHKDITSALNILQWNIFSVQYAHSNLVIEFWLSLNIPYFFIQAFLRTLFVLFLNFNPAGDRALGKRSARMIKIAILNRLFIESLPILIEEAIVQVYYRPTDQIITKQIIVVPSFDNQRRSSWECSLEFEIFVEGWVWLVKQVVISKRCYLIAVFNDQVWVTERTDVTLSKVETFKDIKLDLGGGLSQKLLLDDCFVIGIIQEMQKIIALF
jgi:hypothetical protein